MKVFDLCVKFVTMLTTINMMLSVGHCEGVIMGRLGGRWTQLGCLYTYSGVISGQQFVFWMGDQETEGKFW